MAWIEMIKTLTEAPARAPGAIRLQTLEPHMVADAHALLVLGYRNGGGHVGRFRNWLRWLTRDPEFDPSLCFLAIDAAGTPVGYLHCWDSAFVKDIVVHPDARRQGVATELLSHVFACLHQRGHTSATLKVAVDNHGAIRFYERLGMRPLVQ